jgi:hypothetical protein
MMEKSTGVFLLTKLHAKSDAVAIEGVGIIPRIIKNGFPAKELAQILANHQQPPQPKRSISTGNLISTSIHFSHHHHAIHRIHWSW